MNKFKFSFLLIVAFLLNLQGLMAQSSALINAKDLGAMLSNKELVIVSAQKPEDYNAVHITNSVNLFYKDIQVDTKTGFMKCPDDLAKLAGSMGINENKTIVVYDDGTMKGASHVWWTLKYMGARDVRILDGGLDAWKGARKPVTGTATKITTTTFNLDVKVDMNIFKDEFATVYNANGLVLVDAREADQYRGEKGQTARKGHIPGAVNLEFTEFVANGSFKSKEEILSMVGTLGIAPETKVIVYCNSGVKAAVAYFAMVEIAGLANVRLYEGSFNEWEMNPDNEVVL